MSLQKQQVPRGASLNPNAAEFVPFSLRSTELLSSGKNRSEAVSSDDEASQYWQQHLPDDITPDFGHHAPQPCVGSLNFAGLSLHHNPADAPRLSAPHQHLASPLSLHGDVSSPWDMQLLRSDPQFGTDKDGGAFDETAVPQDPNQLLASVGNNNLNPLDFLATHFTGFAADSLAEVYFANGCDLNLTIEMLTQLELQVDGSLNQNINSKTLSAPNLTSMDFPALPVPDSKSNLQKYAGDEIHQSVIPYGFSDKDKMFLFKSSSSLAAKGATDFASAVRKLASQDSGIWKYDRNGLADSAIGSSRSSHALTGSHNPSASRSSYTERLQSRGSMRPAPVWLETGDAVANLYSELREDARDHARIRNAYFEQARQAYLVGNKALAKELSVKGQLHNMQMKAAHKKAQESIYRQRNPISPGLQGVGRCQEKLIDLHGLHVSEAIHVLKQELSVLRNAARSVDQRLHVYICVGTGHHTRGSRTPARLPVAVQRYLLEEEGLEYSEPQPGLLRVVLY